MRLFTINVKSNPLMRQSKVESDIKAGVRLGGVGFWQEIAPPRYKEALARHAASVGMEVFGLSKECPVTLRTKIWEVVCVHEHWMHGGRILTTPSRWVVEVRTRRALKSDRKVAFIATHFVSAAWSRNHMETRAWRRKMWFIHLEKLKKIVAAAHADGYTVVIGMDANKGVRSMVLHPDQVVVVDNGIDGIIVVPAEGTSAMWDNKVVAEGYFTDHHPVAISAYLSEDE